MLDHDAPSLVVIELTALEVLLSELTTRWCSNSPVGRSDGFLESLAVGVLGLVKLLTIEVIDGSEDLEVGLLFAEVLHDDHGATGLLRDDLGGLDIARAIGAC